MNNLDLMYKLTSTCRRIIYRRAFSKEKATFLTDARVQNWWWRPLGNKNESTGLCSYDFSWDLMFFTTASRMDLNLSQISISLSQITSLIFLAHCLVFKSHSPVEKCRNKTKGFFPSPLDHILDSFSC